MAISAEEMAAVNCVADTNVVAFDKLPQFTTEPETKLLPVIVNVKPAPPARAEDGVKPVVAGTGLGAVLIVNGCELEMPPPGAGLNTVTWAVPELAMSAADMAAVT